MDSRELVVSDMKALITTCDETIADFQAFGERNMHAAKLIDNVSQQLSSLKGYWESAYQYVTARGYDEEGEYSHAKLGYSVSLAYKKYSEIVSGFRFGLDRLKILEEYNKFEMYYRKQRR